MKKLFFYLVVFYAFIGCKSDDSTISANSQVSVGSWKISSYVDKNKDRTSRYSGITFDFMNVGELQVKQGTTVMKKGTWSLVMDSGREKFYISISGTLSDDDLSELNEDWEVVKIESTKMEFGNVSGGNGGTKTLIFSKL